jgi:hypothetical protein
MPLFISKQAERDYYKLRRTLDLAVFKNDRPLMDWCERFLALFRPVRQIRTARLLPHHRKLGFVDLIPKQPPLITNAAWHLPEAFKNKYWKTYPTKRK